MELHCFNEWKNCVLNYDINKIKKSIRPEFIKLQNKLRKFIPTKDDLFGLMLDSYTKEDLKNNVKDRELEEAFYATRYNKIGSNTPWNHIASNYIYLDQKNLYEVYHRFYINTDSDYTHYFAKLFIEKCEEKKYHYYFKFDVDGNRSDTIVIYCSETNLLKFLEILKEIKKEHPELEGHLHKPPFLTANIDDWIGYGSEPSIPNNENERYSYTSLRTKVIEDSMTTLNKEWIKNTKSVPFKGK